MVVGLHSKDDGGGFVATLSPEELECKICSCLYNLGICRPKVLECCHPLCSKCLVKLQDLAESPPGAVVCPFCRYVTRLPGGAVSSLPDDCNLLAVLALRSRNQRNLHVHTEGSTELVLSPRCLSSLVRDSCGNPPSSSSSLRTSSNFVVITITEPPRAPEVLHPRSLSLGPARWTLWSRGSARALVRPAVLLVSLVPAGLVMVTAYGFCRCVCHQLQDRAPPSWTQTDPLGSVRGRSGG
ncbi:E3 ubiquitin-protein ligase RNF182 [Takifugu rubripes]|uniref:E3 ubiquitin-protein ligase RNF182 n=1 Tax=Takifugu rubripes TaxID=31033 RepID=UPI00114603F2|nr:E3 ubiquitin-protein ligase RNF182 [Takifugu rubripes]